MSEETLPPELKCPNCLGELPPLANDCATCGALLEIRVQVGPIPEKRDAYHAARLIAEYLPDMGTPVGDVVTKLHGGQFVTVVQNPALAQNLAEDLRGQGAAASVEVGTRSPDKSSVGAPFPPFEWIRQHPFLFAMALVALTVVLVFKNTDVREEINTAIQNERPTRTQEDIDAEHERARELLRGLEEQGQRHLEQQEGR